MGTWQTKSSKIVYDNPWIFVREDQVIFPNGKEGMYGVVESKSDAVFVIPIDSEDNVYLIQLEHYTTRELVLQCVAGRTDGEPPVVAAKRELPEEAGLEAKEITPLSQVRIASGMTTFGATICLARGLTPNQEHIDEDEAVQTIAKFPVATIKQMILQGDIDNTESISSLLLAFLYLESQHTT
ncbi:MAG TPA: NUDIX hydrolase [Candidatus Saccharimonadales bacterium]